MERDREATVEQDREAILAIRDLHVQFDTPTGMVWAVSDANLVVARSETLAIVGESGSGKSQMMMAAMGLLANNAHCKGEVIYAGRNILSLKSNQLNAIRGRKITMIFQEPMTSLDPLYTIGRQLAEPLVVHGRLGWSQARARALELLALVNMPEPERRISAFPHELSGGQRQRVMIAMALANDPDLLIADEPTTALDATTQQQILQLLSNLQQSLSMAVIFITHDLGIVRDNSDRVCVMRSGEIVEEGPTADVFSHPSHAYTRMLLDAEPTGEKTLPPDDAPIVLKANDIQVDFHVSGGFFVPRHTIRAVDNVSFSLRRGQTLGIVGESGSGKSTLARAALRLLPSQGHVEFHNLDITHCDRKTLREQRRHMQLVFQDPYGSLSPRLTVGHIISEGLLVHEPALTADDRDRRACEAMEEMLLDPATRNRYPHEFSGGQRQRIAIARAMVLKPDLVVLDEPTSALDRTVQKQIVDLLRRLQVRHDLSYIFISHDLSIVRAMADTVMVMREGRMIETGSTTAIFHSPRTEYTKELLSAAVSIERSIPD
ncbi:MAG: ABC transporter ATP-binding protein [Hyphomicrobiaceae bacterium]